MENDIKYKLGNVVLHFTVGEVWQVK